MVLKDENLCHMCPARNDFFFRGSGIFRLVFRNFVLANVIVRGDE